MGSDFDTQNRQIHRALVKSKITFEADKIKDKLQQK